MPWRKPKAKPAEADEDGKASDELGCQGITSAELIRGFIAVFLIVNGTFAIIVAWAARGISDAETMAAIFLGVIGTVTGYYFGQRGADKAQRNADVANLERRVTELASENIDQFKEQVEKYKKQSEKLRTQSTKMKEKIKEYKDLVGDLTSALREVQEELASDPNPDK